MWLLFLMLLIVPEPTNLEREEIEVNYLGTLAMCRAFAPILKKNGGGALVNILSAQSWYTNPFSAGYSASKAAELSLTNSVRIELRAQGTLVIGAILSFAETAMSARYNVPKVSPESIATSIIEGILAGTEEILADQRMRDIKAAIFSADPHAINRQWQKIWDDIQQGLPNPLLKQQ